MNYGNKVVREHGIRADPIPVTNPYEQTTDEWLGDYGDIDLIPLPGDKTAMEQT